MQEDSSNSESTFEFVDSKSESKTQTSKGQGKSVEGAAGESSLLSQVGPPSALPSFVPPSTPATPAPSLSFHPTMFSPVIPAEKGAPVSSPSADSATEATSTPSPGAGTGLMGWVRGYNGLLTKAVEKAKSSVDTVITTLDPQMRDLGLISSGKPGDYEVIVASDKEVKISPVREAFQSIFGSRVVVRGLAAEAKGMAEQPVGFEAGLRGAWLRVEAIRALYPDTPIVAVENFLVEIAPDRWFDVGALVLSDIGCNVTLESFTQMTPVPSAIVTMAQEETPADYLNAAKGFKITIGSLMASNLHVHPSEWHQAMTGVTRREMILLAARSLVNIYKNSLL